VTPEDTIFNFASPALADSEDPSSVELGVKFSSSVSGSVTGIRFYKASANTGSHIGSLWSSTGTLLASATFTNETASGWQYVTFSSPVAITAGTTYVAGYFAPKGHYSETPEGFETAIENAPLTALANGTSSNGVYAYASSSTFPTSSWEACNYSVDVLFAPGSGTSSPPTVPSAPTGVTASPASSEALVSWSAPSSTGGSALTSYTVTPYIGSSAQTPVQESASSTSATITGLTNGSAYTFKVVASNGVGPSSASSASTAVTPEDTIFNFATPALVDSGDPSSVELGVKFSSSVSGSVTGLRFYKASTNTGTHIGSLWSSTGTLLASATFTNETTSGWQYVTFSSPVAITSGTTYVAGYFAPNGHYSETEKQFTAAIENPPLTAPASSNGVYAYASASTFPSSTWEASNYLVDVLFAP
jgi:hypothetical protein